MKLRSIWFAIALWPLAAHADSPAARAEALFRDGRSLMAHGKIAEACAAFDASQKLDPATTTLFNQADCREKNGQLATAWGLFVEAERQTRSATDDTGVHLHQVANDRSTKLESRLSKLTIDVPDSARVPGLVVLRAGVPVDAGEWNRALPIDGGTYAVSARVGDREVWSGSVTIANETDAIEVTVRPARVDTAAAPTADVTTTAPATSEAPRSRLAPWLATIGTGVLLGGALGMELWGESVYNEAKQNHDVNEWSTANDDRYAAEGLLVAGVGCAAIATYLWLHEPTERRSVAPVVSAHFTGLQLQGRW